MSRLKYLQHAIDVGAYKVPSNAVAGDIIDKALRSYVCKYGWTSNGRKGKSERWRRPSFLSKRGQMIAAISWLKLDQAFQCTRNNKGYWI